MPIVMNMYSSGYIVSAHLFIYRKIGILSTGINTCTINRVAGERTSCEVYLPAISCPMSVAFIEPRIQTTLDRSLPTFTYQSKGLGTNKYASEVLANCSVCLSRGLAYMLAFIISQ